MFTQFLRSAIFLCLIYGISSTSGAPLEAHRTRDSQNIDIGLNSSTATDGSTIIDQQVIINGLTMRFKISAPATELVGVNGTNGGNGTFGLNVLFHGDGGQSFFDFPNQGVNNNLMGVALLAPDSNLSWGGSDSQNQTGFVRPDGAAHSTAVNQLLTTELPNFVNFDPTKVFLEGVSGGSLFLSGFLLPQFGSSLGIPGAVLGCGGLPPQLQVQGDLSKIRLHWQSTTNESPDFKMSIPQAVAAYENIAVNAGLSDTQIGQLQTFDASPNGGPCEFDQRAFVSGVQLLTDNYGAIITGNATLNGVTVTNSVVDNTSLAAPTMTKREQISVLISRDLASFFRRP